MLKLITLLSGGSGLWVAIGITIVLLGVGGAGGYTARGVVDAPIISHQETLVAQADQKTQQCIATHEAGRANQAQSALAALTLSIGEAKASIDTLSKKAALRGQSLDQFLKEISNAPPSKLCGGSAAELAYRRSVQSHAPAVPASP